MRSVRTAGRGVLVNDQDGLSTVELAVSSAITLVVLVCVASGLVSALKTGTFGAAQTGGVDAARLVMNQLVRDLQGSPDWVPCLPAGSCAQFTVLPPSGPAKAVRYRLAGRNLHRDIGDSLGNYDTSRVVIDQLANLHHNTSLFTCSVTGNLRQIAVTMKVYPDGARTPIFTVKTAVRQRNAYASTC